MEGLQEYKVRITVKSRQVDLEGQIQDMELFTEGLLTWQEGRAVISYDESETSGMEGSLTVITMAPEHAVILRTGPVSMEQEFLPGFPTDTAYVTPYGRMGIRTDTRQVDLRQDPGDMELFLDYDLYINGNLTSRNTVTVRVLDGPLFSAGGKLV